MTISNGALGALLSTFSASRIGPQQVTPGTPVSFQLQPASLSDLSVTDIVSSTVQLTWITKSVRFSDFGIDPALIPLDASGDNATTIFDPTVINSTSNPLLDGGMPAIVPKVVDLPGLNSVGTQLLDGVPGQLAQLAGNVPLAVQVPVQVKISWDVQDSDGHSILGTTVSAPGGTTSSQVSFVFSPQTVELTTNTAVPVVHCFVVATVTLSAGDAAPQSLALPPIPVDVPAIPIPRVIVYFRHTNFAPMDGDDDGAAFIVVPNNSPLQSVGQLQSILDTLQSTASNLSSIASFASFLLGLTTLSNALAAQPHVQFRVANGSNNFDNFNDVTLISRFWNDIEAEDEMSSLIFIGPAAEASDGGPRQAQVKCFNDRNEDPDQGEFDLANGPKLFTAIRDLHKGVPVSEPDGDEITVVHAPAGRGGIREGFHSITTFGDELSSMSFT